MAEKDIFEVLSMPTHQRNLNTWCIARELTESISSPPLSCPSFAQLLTFYSTYLTAPTSTVYYHFTPQHTAATIWQERSLGFIYCHLLVRPSSWSSPTRQGDGVMTAILTKTANKAKGFQVQVENEGNCRENGTPRRNRNEPMPGNSESQIRAEINQTHTWTSASRKMNRLDQRRNVFAPFLIKTNCLESKLVSIHSHCCCTNGRRVVILVQEARGCPELSLFLAKKAEYHLRLLYIRSK